MPKETPSGTVKGSSGGKVGGASLPKGSGANIQGSPPKASK
jgi:hypothetical protein